MEAKERWPSAALREARGDAARAYCDMPNEDREAGIALIREEWERTASVVRTKIAFFKLFDWIPTMDELYNVTGIEVWQ